MSSLLPHLRSPAIAPTMCLLASTSYFFFLHVDCSVPQTKMHLCRPTLSWKECMLNPCFHNFSLQCLTITQTCCVLPMLICLVSSTQRSSQTPSSHAPTVVSSLTRPVLAVFSWKTTTPLASMNTAQNVDSCQPGSHQILSMATETFPVCCAIKDVPLCFPLIRVWVSNMHTKSSEGFGLVKTTTIMRWFLTWSSLMLS